jgi:phosphoglycolate phosphatase
MKMNFEAAIFDLDGTLVDSIEDIADSMNRVLSENHFPVHSLAAYKIFVGRGLLNLTRVSLPATAQDEKTVMACYERMQEIYNDRCTEKTKPYDGIIPLLNELKSRELKLAVFSNKADKFTRKIVQALMPGYFDIVIGMTTEELKKPNPACALKISEHFGTRPENMVYLGDTGIDMQTARNAEMYGVGVLWGFRTKEELISAGAKAIVSHPLDLTSLF